MASHATTKRLQIEMGPYSLDVTVAVDANLDGQFDVLCNDTGERLRINGWLIEDIEEVGP